MGGSRCLAPTKANDSLQELMPEGKLMIVIITNTDKKFVVGTSVYFFFFAMSSTNVMTISISD